MYKFASWMGSALVLTMFSANLMAEEAVKKEPTVVASATETIKPAAKTHRKHHTDMHKKLEEKKNTAL